MAHIEFMSQSNRKTEHLFLIHFQMENRQRQLWLSICGSCGSRELTLCMTSFLYVSLTFAEGLLTLTNLAGSCWRTRDYERARCMEKGPRGGFFRPRPAPAEQRRNQRFARPLPSDLCYHGEAHNAENPGTADSLVITVELCQ